MSSVNNNIPFVPENTIDPAAGLNLSINIIDAILQIAVVSVGANTPPGSPANGARYIVGTSPTGAWVGQANKLARWLDSAWSFFDARYAVNLTDSQLYIRGASGWAAVSGGSGMTNPMTTAGDIIVGGTGGSPSRLGAGANGQVLKIVGGALVWAAEGAAAQQCIPIACSDEVTALTSGTAKVTFRMPYAFTLSKVRASLTTPQTSGSILTIDINEGGTSILSTKLTIDNTEKTSTTAAAPAVISDTSLADDAEITIDLDQIGDGTAKGLKVYLIGVPA